jgi:hypothetical protein
MSDFKRYIESRGVEDGGWRGEVHGAREQSAPQARDGRSPIAGGPTNPRRS